MYISVQTSGRMNTRSDTVTGIQNMFGYTLHGHTITIIMTEEPVYAESTFFRHSYTRDESLLT